MSRMQSLRSLESVFWKSGKSHLSQIIIVDPLIIIVDPQIIIGDPQIIIGDPQIIIVDPQIIIVDPQIIIGDPQIFIGDPHGGRGGCSQSFVIAPRIFVQVLAGKKIFSPSSLYRSYSLH